MQKNGKIITADEGKWLYNKKDRTFAHTAHLNREETAAYWTEITDAEYEELTAAMEAEEAEEAGEE